MISTTYGSSSIQCHSLRILIFQYTHDTTDPGLNGTGNNDKQENGKLGQLVGIHFFQSVTAQHTRGQQKENGQHGADSQHQRSVVRLPSTAPARAALQPIEKMTSRNTDTFIAHSSPSVCLNAGSSEKPAEGRHRGS
uniref:Uncharacterized protein n=1 Tax=Rhipicephalus zambeziensis TaxID=60191 RepID=A0A224Y748_9ACAR